MRPCAAQSRRRARGAGAGAGGSGRASVRVLSPSEQPLLFHLRQPASVGECLALACLRPPPRTSPAPLLPPLPPCPPPSPLLELPLLQVQRPLVRRCGVRAMLGGALAVGVVAGILASLAGALRVEA